MSIAMPSPSRIVWSPPQVDLCQTVNSRYCVFLLCALAATHIIIVHVFFDDTLPCFCPSYYTNEHCDIFKAHCRTTRNVLFEDDLESPLPQQGERDALSASIPHYYQYVSLILLLQAVLFYIPGIIERHLLAKLAGILPEEVALSAINVRHTTNRSDKEAAIQDIALHVSLYCTRQIRRRHVSYSLWWLQGNQVVLLELVSKAVYVANVIGQFFMLDVFLGMPFHSYGWQIMGHNALHSAEVFLSSVLGLSEDAGIVVIHSILEEQSINITIPTLNWTRVDFPTSGLCEFAIRQVGNVYHHTVQCLLPVNTLNELIFSFLWFLMLAVAVVTVASFLVSLYGIVFFHSRRMAVREMLQDAGVLAPRGQQGCDRAGDEENRGGCDMDLVGSFENGYLQRNGLFLLDAIQAAAGDVVALEVLKLVWSSYKENVHDLQILATTRVRYEERWIDEPRQIPVSNIHVRSQRLDDPQQSFIPMATQASVEPDSPPPYMTTSRQTREHS